MFRTRPFICQVNNYVFLRVKSWLLVSGMAIILISCWFCEEYASAHQLLSVNMPIPSCQIILFLLSVSGMPIMFC